MACQSFPTWIYPGSISRTIRRVSSEFLHEDPQSVHLVLTSPPDLSETNLTNWAALFSLYSGVFSKCVACLAPEGVVSIVISDRKYRGSVIHKHAVTASVLESLGLHLFAYKVVLRHRKIDLYRYSFSHLMCFRFPGIKARHTQTPPHFKADVLGPYPEFVGVSEPRSSFSPHVVKLIIESFTTPDERVLDPFCGTGTTQRVALGLGRKAVGYEINSALGAYWKTLNACSLKRRRGSKLDRPEQL